MLTSKRQEWILQMIKGPDIAPVSNSPGHYTSKNTVSITAENQKVTIRPEDVLDLSSPEFLTVLTNDNRRYEIRWEQIISLDFEEEKLFAAMEPLKMRASANRMMLFPVRRKLV